MSFNMDFLVDSFETQKLSYKEHVRHQFCIQYAPMKSYLVILQAILVV